MALVGGGALGTVGTETYVWKTGDPYRSSRELHEALLMLGFLGGLMWNPASVGLNQKVGGTFNDEQRARGGKIFNCVSSGRQHSVSLHRRGCNANERG